MAPEPSQGSEQIRAAEETKQVARALGISVKAADSHIQHAYRKVGVSTRAAAALFAMEHGLIASGELPIVRTSPRS